MKKLLILSVCASALGLTASALAQAAGPAGGAPKGPEVRQGKGDRKALQKMQEEILAKLNLTDEQKAKIKAHEEEMKTKMQALRKGNKGAKGDGKSEDVKEKIKALRKEQQAFMKQTLTKDQMREFQKLRAEKLKEMREKSAPGTPGA